MIQKMHCIMQLQHQYQEVRGARKHFWRAWDKKSHKNKHKAYKNCHFYVKFDINSTHKKYKGEGGKCPPGLALGIKRSLWTSQKSEKLNIRGPSQFYGVQLKSSSPA